MKYAHIDTHYAIYKKAHDETITKHIETSQSVADNPREVPNTHVRINTIQSHALPSDRGRPARRGPVRPGTGRRGRVGGGGNAARRIRAGGRFARSARRDLRAGRGASRPRRDAAASASPAGRAAAAARAGRSRSGGRNAESGGRASTLGPRGRAPGPTAPGRPSGGGACRPMAPPAPRARALADTGSRSAGGRSAVPAAGASARDGAGTRAVMRRVPNGAPAPGGPGPRPRTGRTAAPAAVPGSKRFPDARRCDGWPSVPARSSPSAAPLRARPGSGRTPGPSAPAWGSRSNGPARSLRSPLRRREGARSGPFPESAAAGAASAASAKAGRRPGNPPAAGPRSFGEGSFPLCFAPAPDRRPGRPAGLPRPPAAAAVPGRGGRYSPNAPGCRSRDRIRARTAARRRRRPDPPGRPGFAGAPGAAAVAAPPRDGLDPGLRIRGAAALGPAPQGAADAAVGARSPPPGDDRTAAGGSMAAARRHRRCRPSGPSRRAGRPRANLDPAGGGVLGGPRDAVGGPQAAARAAATVYVCRRPAGTRAGAEGDARRLRTRRLAAERGRLRTGSVHARAGVAADPSAEEGSIGGADVGLRLGPAPAPGRGRRLRRPLRIRAPRSGRRRRRTSASSPAFASAVPPRGAPSARIHPSVRPLAAFSGRRRSPGRARRRSSPALRPSRQRTSPRPARRRRRRSASRTPVRRAVEPGLRRNDQGPAQRTGDRPGRVSICVPNVPTCRPFSCFGTDDSRPVSRRRRREGGGEATAPVSVRRHSVCPSADERPTAGGSRMDDPAGIVGPERARPSEALPQGSVGPAQDRRWLRPRRCGGRRRRGSATVGQRDRGGRSNRTNRATSRREIARNCRIRWPDGSGRRRQAGRRAREAEASGITPDHRARQAIVHLRPSSARQLRRDAGGRERWIQACGARQCPGLAGHRLHRPGPWPLGRRRRRAARIQDHARRRPQPGSRRHLAGGRDPALPKRPGMACAARVPRRRRPLAGRRADGLRPPPADGRDGARDARDHAGARASEHAQALDRGPRSQGGARRFVPGRIGRMPSCRRGRDREGSGPAGPRGDRAGLPQVR